MNFGERLIELRKAKGYTREAFAEYLGISKYTLRNYELSVNDPGSSFLKQISDIFNVSIDYLLGLTNEKERMSPYSLKTSEYEHIKKYRSLDQFGQETVSYILDRELERTAQLKEWQDGNSDTSKMEEVQVIYLPELYSRFSAGTGQYSTDSGYEMTEVPRNALTSQATSIATISGDSMEPEYQNGDRVLIKTMPDIEIGEIGVWSINNELYIKAKGDGELISLNPDYDNIAIKENDSAYCIGKVLGKLD